MRSTLPMLTNNFWDVDRLMDDFFGRDFGLSQIKQRRSGSYDLVQKNDCYELNVDLPGIKPEDVHLEIDGNTLKIEAERKSEERKETETLLVNNRYYGKISHAFTVGEDVDPSQIQAQFENGTLRVSLKKRTVSQPRRIEIGAKVANEGRKLQSA